MVSRLRHPWEAASLPGYSILSISIVMLAIVGCTLGTVPRIFGHPPKGRSEEV